jgi:hypothetical protein
VPLQVVKNECETTNFTSTQKKSTEEKKKKLNEMKEKGVYWLRELNICEMMPLLQADRWIFSFRYCPWTAFVVFHESNSQLHSEL